MFQFSRCPPYPYLIQNTVHGHYSMWVPPFGYLRISICLRLPAAFRSLPRPSSATGAKASSLRSFMLDLPSLPLPPLPLRLLPVSGLHVFASRSPLAVFSSLSFFELSGFFVSLSAEIVCFRILFLPCSFPTLLLPSHSFSLFSSQGTLLSSCASEILLPLPPLWWAQVESNHRPRAYQARALTI